MNNKHTSGSQRFHPDRFKCSKCLLRRCRCPCLCVSLFVYFLSCPYPFLDVELEGLQHFTATYHLPTIGLGRLLKIHIMMEKNIQIFASYYLQCTRYYRVLDTIGYLILNTGYYKVLDTIRYFILYGIWYYRVLMQKGCGGCLWLYEMWGLNFCDFQCT